MATMKGSDWTSASNFLLRKQERHCGLTIVPEGNALDALRGDYQRMLEDGLLLEDTESFDLLMVKCKKIQEQVKRLSAIEDKT
jgi:hypothetical protein